jgi:hypothetical protein
MRRLVSLLKPYDRETSVFVGRPKRLSTLILTFDFRKPGLTGVIAQTFTYPLDVVRRHMQLHIMIEDLETK